MVTGLAVILGLVLMVAALATGGAGMLKVIYAVFLGLILAIFVGIGISAFYEAPKAPEAPQQVIVKEPTEAQIREQQDFERQMTDFNETKMATYNRNVSLLALGFALVFLAISLLFDRSIRVIADGVLLGSVFTLLYSMGRSFASQNSKFSFVIVTVGVAVAVFLGYWRFLRLKTR